MRIREGGPQDAALVLGMFDSAVAWLSGQGRTGQWGQAPFTGDERRERQVGEWAAGGGMRIAEVAGGAAGCVVVGAANAYVSPAPVPELYVQALVTDHRYAGRGVGRALLEWAHEEAGQRGVRVLRVDCYAGDDQRLVGYYEGCGFTRVAPFTVGQWPGMLLERPLP
jgi:GNAT superfamily N-acetyltransferase